MTIDPQDDRRLLASLAGGLALLAVALLLSGCSLLTPEPEPPKTGAVRCFVGVPGRPFCLQLNSDNSGGPATCQGDEPRCCELADNCVEVGQ